MFHCGLPHLKARKRRAVQPAPKVITFRANGFPQEFWERPWSPKSRVAEGWRLYEEMGRLKAEHYRSAEILRAYQLPQVQRYRRSRAALRGPHARDEAKGQLSLYFSEGFG